MLKNALLASALGLSIYALSMNANAGHRSEGWYAALEGGANWIDDTNIDVIGVPPLNWTAEFESGWAAFVEVGYEFQSNWRLELEAGWRQNDVDCVSTGLACVTGNWGQVNQFTHMLNVVHDIDISERTALSVGFGVGGNLVQAEDTPIALRDDTDWNLAAQVLVQVSHKLTDRVDFMLTYRYMVSEDPQFERFAAPAVAFENDNHTVTVGLRFKLHGDPEPMDAPVTSTRPPEPPPTPRQFVVYFGFNKSNLTAEAMQVVKEAASAARAEGTASILVTGHTDTAGSSVYNQRLSVTRANVVKKALVGEGIPAGAITATGKGKTQLEVQTSDHQREPRNRRATIDLGANKEGEPEANLEPAPRPEASLQRPLPEVALSEELETTTPLFVLPPMSPAT